MVPNHGLIIHSLLHGENDFSETMKIINTCSQDTDCNSGNVGCLMGIKNGLQGIDLGLNKGADWRGPVADKFIFRQPIQPGAFRLCQGSRRSYQFGRALAAEELWQPKGNAPFHFDFRARCGVSP